MSDVGGPEDPEVAKLREQLAAAERAAELRSELEAAKEELLEIDNKIGEVSGAASLKETAATDTTPKDHDLPKPSPNAPDPSSAKWWVVAALLVVVVGVALLSTRPWKSEGQESNTYSAAIADKGDRSDVGAEPTLKLECPEPFTGAEARIQLTVGAEWSWSKKAGFASLRVKHKRIKAPDGTHPYYVGYGKPLTRTEQTPYDSNLRALFTNTYSGPNINIPTEFRIEATLQDGALRTVSATCKISWTYLAPGAP